MHGTVSAGGMGRVAYLILTELMQNTVCSPPTIRNSFELLPQGYCERKSTSSVLSVI